jgi:hypothetical protein
MIVAFVGIAFLAELVIRSTGAGLFITAAGHVISGRRSVYYGADCFIPGRSVDGSRCPLSIAFRSTPVEAPCKSSVIQRSAHPAVKRPADRIPRVFQRE